MVAHITAQVPIPPSDFSDYLDHWWDPWPRQTMHFEVCNHCLGRMASQSISFDDVIKLLELVGARSERGINGRYTYFGDKFSPSRLRNLKVVTAEPGIGRGNYVITAYYKRT